jgi:nitrite reductase/ring-hydroxylating ferredoxin subunit
MKHPRHTSTAGCDIGACSQASASRRAFLQGTAGAFALALFGAGGTEASALPVLFMDNAQTGGERRYPIPAADSVNIDRGAQLIVARFKSHVYVFALSCPHQNAAVKWLSKDQRFQCTKHDSEYKPDGLYTTGHATRNLDRYAIARDGDSVVVDVHHWFQSDKNPDAWAAAAIAL